MNNKTFRGGGSVEAWNCLGAMCLPEINNAFEQLKTRSEVQDLDEYAGILGEETILIDVDDAETSELLFRIVQDLELKCRV